jgi:hypothetical protein
VAPTAPSHPEAIPNQRVATCPEVRLRLPSIGLHKLSFFKSCVPMKRSIGSLSLYCAFFLSSAAIGAECVAPTKETQLQPDSACSNAMCCPRELELQINLVRAVARKLKSLGYEVSAQGAEPENSPEVNGSYNPTKPGQMRDAIRQFKKANKIAGADDRLTYELVYKLLGANLFGRWKVR